MNTKEKIRKYVKIFLWVGNLLVLAIPITQKLIGKQGGRVKVVSEKENVRKEEKVIEEEPKPKVVSHDKKQKKHQIRTRQTRIAKKREKPINPIIFWFWSQIACITTTVTPNSSSKSPQNFIIFTQGVYPFFRSCSENFLKVVLFCFA